MAISHTPPQAVLTPPKPVAKKAPLAQRRKTGFFDLPGEIRNKIYDLIIPFNRILITAKHTKRPVAKDGSPSRGHPRRSLGHKLLSKHVTGMVRTFIRVPVGVLLVSRAVHHEVISMIYARTEFCFHSLFTLNRFMNRAPKQGLENIRKIEIKHHTYGEPHLLADRMWKIAHDRSWDNTCERVPVAMKRLQSLVLVLSLNEWPIELKVDERWARTVMMLAGKGLEYADISLTHNAFTADHLQKVAFQLEDAMIKKDKLSQKAKIKEAQAKARARDRNVKATKILRVVLPPA